MKLACGAHSIAGKHHAANEDRYRLQGRDVAETAVAERGQIFAVFDGISKGPDMHEIAACIAKEIGVSPEHAARQVCRLAEN